MTQIDETKEPRDDEPVGYRRPPRHSRFKPGQSGNPKGKRKGVQNFTSEVKNALRALVKVSANGVARKMTTQKAVLLRTIDKALKGDPRSADTVIELSRLFNNEASTTPDGPSSAEDDAILEAYEAEILELHGQKTRRTRSIKK